MDNLTLISCSYNTPVITENMLKSFLSIHPKTKVLISENSSNDDTETILKTANIPYIRNVGGLHGPSVDLLLEKVETDYALLVDTDVIFLKSHEEIFKSFVDMDLCLMGEIVGDRGGKRLHKRVNPWHCFINVKQVKENGIKFFDEVKMKSRDEVRYDVGSSFFEEVKSKKLKIAELKGDGFYYRHYEGMSWRTLRYGKTDGDIDTDVSATHNNIGLYTYGMQILEKYNNETGVFKKLALRYDA